jgi:protein-S-isoprenylcysteine O-methyltransferase Ste14
VSAAAGQGATPEPPDHPDLPVKPPLVFLAAIAVGLGIDHWFPMSVRPEGLGWTGALLLGLAVALSQWAMHHFRTRKTSVFPWKPTRVILEDGPFAFTRNPIYLSFAMAQLGIGLALDALAVVLLVVPAVLATDRWVIRREEAYLERKFGDAYRAYRGRVRRWF